jgi:tRNA(fMet)-specific endonuclease VapC
MSYLFDTDWLVSFLNGREEAVKLVGSLVGAGIAASIISVGEIYEGIQGDPQAAQRISQFAGFLATIDVIPPDREIARRYGELRSDLRSRGLLIPDNDIWIAATCLARGLTLASRDGHFSRISGLKLHQSP